MTDLLPSIAQQSKEKLTALLKQYDFKHTETEWNDGTDTFYNDYVDLPDNGYEHSFTHSFNRSKTGSIETKFKVSGFEIRKNKDSAGDLSFYLEHTTLVDADECTIKFFNSEDDSRYSSIVKKQNYLSQGHFELQSLITDVMVQVTQEEFISFFNATEKEVLVLAKRNHINKWSVRIFVFIVMAMIAAIVYIDDVSGKLQVIAENLLAQFVFK